ncbi:MAG: YtxH domain-containing protein [Cyanobacteria bacterium]|nr:YtxH domain-containing protein [Cyanobacteriota bacterium]
MRDFIKMLADRINNFMLYFGIAIGAIGGLLGGLGVGVIIGIFIAPRSGKELRRDIKRKATDTFDSMRNYTSRQSSHTDSSDSNGDHEV